MSRAGKDEPPPPEALRWVGRSVGPGAAVESFTKLPGATSSVLHALRVNYHGRQFELVLRRFVDAEWLWVEPDLARHEAAALGKAGLAGVPVPLLVAFDEGGEACGAPATLMTRLPGGVELMPDDFDAWLRGLAEALVPLHEIGAEELAWSYYPYADIQSLEVPGWSRAAESWRRALEIVKGPWPRSRECFIHRDYHPANVLWEGARVSGVVDWVNACRGPAGVDVAWCRHNLARMYGVSAADKFLDAYRRLAGPRFAYEPFWDLITVVELLPGPPGVYEGWPAFGLTRLDDETIRARVDEYVTGLVARL
ncbi:MAG TPA: aminoglycoside phosphotransferase family protein [Pyrinomonadaceae bacterium]|nr:aminoglycoside phosphotransferase family protein [Pyrinomonadaceae bacterium]